MWRRVRSLTSQQDRDQPAEPAAMRLRFVLYRVQVMAGPPTHPLLSIALSPPTTFLALTHQGWWAGTAPRIRGVNVALVHCPFHECDTHAHSHTCARVCMHSAHTSTAAHSHTHAHVLERQAMMDLDHPNIVRFVAAFLAPCTNTSVCIVEQLAEGGSLQDALRTTGKQNSCVVGLPPIQLPNPLSIHDLLQMPRSSTQAGGGAW